MARLFPISIEVEEDAVGRVLRVLNATAGIAKLHLRLDKEVKPEESQREGGVVQTTPSPPALRDGRSNRNTPMAKSPSYQAIAAVLMKTPAHYKILAEAVKRAGYKGIAVHGYLHRLTGAKMVIRTSPGSYKITEKGIRTFGKKETVPRLERRGSNKENALSSFYKSTNNYSGFRLLVLTTLHKVEDMSSVDMKRVVTDAGFSEKNLSTTGMKLRNEGLITVDNGWYHITEKGKQVMDNRPSLENDNGPDHNEEGIEANG